MLNKFHISLDPEACIAVQGGREQGGAAKFRRVVSMFKQLFKTHLLLIYIFLPQTSDSELNLKGYNLLLKHFLLVSVCG